MRLPIFFLMVISLTFIYTWVFNHTRGSIFIAIVLHASLNTFGIVQSPSIFSASIVTSSDLLFLLGFAALAIAVLILTRGSRYCRRSRTVNTGYFYASQHN
jgi:hypothetical protein